MAAPWLGAVVVLRPASTTAWDEGPATASAAWDDHSRWIREMNQEYAWRLSMAKTSSVGPGSGSGRSTATGYAENTGYEEVDDEVPVYRSIEPGGWAGRAAGGLALQPVCQSPTQWATQAEVDEEWKRSYPPMLRRQAAFRP